MESSAIRAYEILKKHNFSAEEAEIVIASKDESLSKWVASKDDVIAIKEDIAALDMKIASVRTELKENIASVKSSMIWWFIGISAGVGVALFGALTSVIIAAARGMIR